MSAHLFIGRYQAPHKGHQTIFETYLKNNEPIIIAIRDVATDSSNPFSAEQVKGFWETIYKNNPLVKVIIIPDIKSVNYGRGVGYEVNEIQVSNSIANISATEIRKQIAKGQTDWQKFVDQSIWQSLANTLNN